MFQLQLKLRYVQDEVHRLTQMLREAASPTSPTGTNEALTPIQKRELQTRLQTLKSEFTQLLTEMRRRRSLVEGSAVLFEVILILMLSLVMFSRQKKTFCITFYGALKDLLCDLVPNCL